MRGYVIYANDARGSRFFRTNERFPRFSGNAAKSLDPLRKRQSSSLLHLPRHLPPETVTLHRDRSSNLPQDSQKRTLPMFATSLRRFARAIFPSLPQPRRCRLRKCVCPRSVLARSPANNRSRNRRGNTWRKRFHVVQRKETIPRISFFFTGIITLIAWRLIGSAESPGTPVADNAPFRASGACNCLVISRWE